MTPSRDDRPNQRPTPPSARRMALWTLLTMIVSAAWLLLATSEAAAGTYRAAQCHPGLGAGHADLAFQRSGQHYRPESSCRELGRGVGITHQARSTPAGRWGAWSLRAPIGTAIRQVRAMVSGRAKGGHVPELLIGGDDGAPRPFGSAAGAYHPLLWTGAGATRFQARLRCSTERGCGPGRDAHLHARRITVKLDDRQAPELGASGGLVSGRTVRGTQTLIALARDFGGGVRRAFAEVNGEPVAARTMRCALAGKVATRLSPCPASHRAELAIDTRGAPFRQGPNDVRLCATDYAPDSSANRSCRARRVRVDNDCPVSGASEGVRLQARFEGAGDRIAVDGDEGVRVSGRLLDSSGDPVAGAEVCVATRVRLRTAAERVVATPVTASNGRFLARVAAGPSREVRIAHWRRPGSVAESYLDLRSRAKPSLRVRPRRSVRNGDRVRFTADLDGPREAGRRVMLRVRSHGRWLLLRTGRTDAEGEWTSGYRFRSTTRDRTYRFRAHVPRQDGYPYEAGRSGVRRVRVSGR